MITIPWIMYSEEAIHKIIERCYQIAGFDVHNVHESDRSHESGADLLITKDGEDVVFAVKIKPKKIDLQQLQELSRRKEKRKIYIYIKTPAAGFLERMKTDGKGVIFFDKDMLTEELFRVNPYFSTWLYLSTTRFEQKLAIIRSAFLKIYQCSEESKDPLAISKMDLRSLNSIWRLKDFSVMLHKSFLLFKEFFYGLSEDSLRVSEHYKILDNYSRVLDIVLDNILSFDSVLLEFYDRNKDRINNTVKKTKTRSNWIHLFNFNSINPDNIIDFFKEDEERTKHLLEMLQGRFGVKEDSNIIVAIKDHASYIMSFAWGVEATIDDFFTLGE